MKISVLGIGYVGAVSAACLVRDGHEVICADPNPKKVDAINAGEAPILESGLAEAVKSGAASGLLTATLDTSEAVLNSDLSLVCVGTPSRMNGSLDTGYVIRSAEEIGQALRLKESFHSVVVRSTLLPGSMRDIVIPALEQAAGGIAGEDFGVGYYPEFLREGTALKDYYAPGVVLFGRYKQDEVTIQRLKDTCAAVPVAPMIIDLAEAEAIKYANNCWHALKISFANEIGNICKASGLDGHSIMNVLCADTKLNISPAYLRPGFAFGGSCLPKDLRALRYRARELDVPTPVLDATLAANEVQLSRAFDAVIESGSRRIGLMGLSFKADTDDLRESPLVDLAERLHGKGYDLRIHDPCIDYSNLTGSNLHYIRSHIPHLASLLVSAEELVAHAEVLVMGKRDATVEGLIAASSDAPQLVDLARIDPNRRSGPGYQGICW